MHKHACTGHIVLYIQGSWSNALVHGLFRMHCMSHEADV